MRTGNFRYPIGAEKSAPQTSTPTGSASVLGGFEFDPLDIPFLPFAGPSGLVALSDGQRVGERKPNVRQQTCRK